MGEVYANSLINLVAAAASDGPGGCFFNRFYPLVFIMRVQDFIWKCSLDEILPSVALNEASTTAKRGWCFQERLLAHRCVYFCKNQVFWECRTLTASELEPRGYGRLGSLLKFRTHAKFEEQDTGYHWKSLTHGFNNARLMYERDKLVAIWRGLVQGYSETKLTYARDKLVAVSGVAKMIYNLRNEKRITRGKDLRPSREYFAGIFLQGMVYQLL